MSATRRVVVGMEVSSRYCFVGRLGVAEGQALKICQRGTCDNKAMHKLF